MLARDGPRTAKGAHVSPKTLLVVDDDPIARDNLARILEHEGHRALQAESGPAALEIIAQRDLDLVVTDLKMPGMDGLALLAEAKRLRPDTEIILMTGYASVGTAVQAMRDGAYDYISKPFEVEEMRALVEKALEKRGLRAEIAALRQRIESDRGITRFVGQDPTIQALKETIAQVSQLDCNVLIMGETGTGKELVARIIHELSPRADKRFMAVNCGAFSADLIDNELFGHAPEAYTGANKVKKGILETVDGGVIFFDEIGELPLAQQVKLLRILQERKLIRVGDTKEIDLDMRVLAATNKDLKMEVERGEFRMDLYYRLNVIALRLPTLAERRSDIPLLVRHFLAKHSPQGRPMLRITDEVMDILTGYDFPGNVRELENIIERAVALCEGGTFEPRHLPADLVASGARARRSQDRTWPTLEDNERRYIGEVLEEVGGNKTRAAEILGIDRVSLWRKLKRYEMDA